MNEHIGELAALATVVCWTLSAFSFELAGRAIGSMAVNWLRLLLALAMLCVLGALLRGRAWPSDADAHAWVWLSVSGLVGFAFGDLCLFRAFLELGTRLASLVMSLAPPLTAVIGWLVLGETLGAVEIGAIALTVGGVALAVSERDAGARSKSAPESESALPSAAPSEPPSAAVGASTGQRGKGLLLAVGGAFGQALGLVLSKFGMGEYSALAATQIRVLAGLLGLSLVFSAWRLWPRLWAARGSARGLSFTTLGAVTGPVLGVTLSLYAVQHTETGVAASIMATVPILAIPISAVLYGERITARGVLGAFVAVVGVILLF